MTLPLPVEPSTAQLYARVLREASLTARAPLRQIKIATHNNGQIDRPQNLTQRVQKRNVLLGEAACRGEAHADHDQPAKQNCTAQLHPVLRRPLRGSVQVANVRGIDAHAA